MAVNVTKFEGEAQGQISLFWQPKTYIIYVLNPGRQEIKRIRDHTTQFQCKCQKLVDFCKEKLSCKWVTVS